MQLKDKKKTRLAMAASSLLGATHSATLKAEEAGWNYDALMSGYAESDDRVNVVSFKMKGAKEDEDSSAVSFLIGIDAISGSSPTGAVGFAGLAKEPVGASFSKALAVDTLARSSGSAAPPPAPAPRPAPRPAAPAPRPATSSGGGSHPAPASNTPRPRPRPAPRPATSSLKSYPLYGNVEDSRYSGSVSWTTPVGRLTKLNYGLSGSAEEDYKDIGINSSISRDFNQKNTTLSAGINYAHDEIDGTIGNHAPLSSVFASNNEIGKQTKDVTDILLGVTQIFSKSVIGEFNYTLSSSSGYMNDPYKVVSIVNSKGQPVDHLYENRPDSRLSHALYGEYRIKTSRGVVKPSYRFFTNDWGITSHTFGLAYRRDLGKKSFIEPRLRFYTQTAADFYHTQLGSRGAAAPYASADYRLAGFDAVTIGLHLGGKTRKGNHWRAGVDYYTHRGKESDNQPPGQIRVNPDLQAITLRLDWSF